MEDLEVTIKNAPSPQARTPTPPVTLDAKPSLFTTFKKTQDIYQALNTLKKSLYTQNRTVRHLFRKVKKTLDIGAAEKALLNTENNCL